MGWIGWDWIGLDWIGLDWVGLAGLDWLGWIGLGYMRQFIGLRVVSHNAGRNQSIGNQSVIMGVGVYHDVSLARWWGELSGSHVVT
jgi:hypothetical protein